MLYADIGDSELIYLMRTNNNEAKKVLFDRYKKRIYGVINSYSKKYFLSNVSYDDYFGECFIVFLKCLELYDDEYNFYYYVLEAIERKLTRIEKKEKPYREILELDENIKETYHYANDASYQYRQSEINNFIDEVFSDKDKQIINFRLQGYKFNEIATKMGINEKNLYKNNSRIKKKLSEKFKRKI